MREFVDCDKCGNKVKNDSKAFELANIRNSLFGGIHLLLCGDCRVKFCVMVNRWLKDKRA